MLPKQDGNKDQFFIDQNFAGKNIDNSVRSVGAKLTNGLNYLLYVAEAVRIGGGPLATSKKAIHVLKTEGTVGFLRRTNYLKARINSKRPSATSHASGEYPVTVIGADPKSQPLISIIVPNYNHAKYLPQRLESIYSQTLQNFDVILLDDCSTDNSLDVLHGYQVNYNGNTRLIANSQNSGCGYRQWAKGELIWIAESDDWCEPDFLQTLVPKFADESVMLAYVNSAFTDSAGAETIWSTDRCLADIDPVLWLQKFEKTGHQIVNEAWAIKNIVPNVSGALFMTPGPNSELLTAPWTEMKICGDWQFYLQQVRGGSVAYVPEIKNYYRIHSESTAKSTFSKDIYYQEHQKIARYVIDNFAVDRAFVYSQEQNLKVHWQQNRNDYSDEKFRCCYNASEILDCTSGRKPNILMVEFAFSAGGGETFPIFLANLLKARGYTVTFLSWEYEPRVQRIRKLLRSDIPVVIADDAMEKFVDAFGIDIIHSHHAWADSTILNLLPPDSRAKMVVTTHGMYEAMELNRQQKLIGQLLERADAIVLTAKKNLQPFENLGFGAHPKLHRISNALPNVPVSPINRRDLNISEDAFLLCIVSRAIPEKGWAESLQAVFEARKATGLDIQLLLIGGGPEYERLRKEDHFKGFAQFLGFKHNLRDYYAISDLGFLPTRFSGESFPLTLIDCLSTDTPFLATDIGEIRAMLESESGMAGAVFSLNNGKLPIDKIAHIIGKFAQRGSEYRSIVAAVPDAYNKFNSDRMVDDYERVYKSVLGRV